MTLGLVFYSDVPGVVTGVRFYKGPGNTGQHIGQLWSANGARLASVTFSNESTSGWQQAQFSSPVAIAANTNYVVSYSAPNGRYSIDTYYRWVNIDASPLHVSGSSPGVYNYGSGSRFPSKTWRASNYWVDIIFTPATAPPLVQISMTPTSRTLGSGQSQQFTASVTGSTNTGVTWTASPSVGTLSANGLYTAPASVSSAQTVTITARSVADTTKSATATVSLTADPPPLVQISMTPTSRTLGSGQSQQFTASVTGSTNTGVTWTASPSVGALSASGLYTAPASISSAETVTITARSVADSTKTATATVSLTADPPPAVQISVTPTSRTLGSGQSQQFTASVTGSTNTGVTWTASPSVGTLSASGLYTAPASISSAQTVTITVRSVADTTKTATATVSLTADPPPPTETELRSFWDDAATPGIQSVGNDSASVTLGLQFRSDVPGEVVGVRFFKGSGNTGTHVGNLWSSSGANLGQVTFTNETSSGWQQAVFATPIRIAENTTYVVSYLAPRGAYAADENFGWSGADAAPLRMSGPTPGVYAYGSTAGFPTGTWHACNYWVDVIFVPDSGSSIPTPPTTYTISGIVRGSSATISLSGPKTGTTTTNASGGYSFTGLQNGTYVVVPSKSGYTFAPSSAAATIQGASVVVADFTATSVPTTPRSVTLSWNPSVTSGISGYNLYRATFAGGPYAKVNSSLIAGTSYVDYSVVSGQTYYYVATATDTGGTESTYSNQAAAPLN